METRTGGQVRPESGSRAGIRGAGALKRGRERVVSAARCAGLLRIRRTPLLLRPVSGVPAVGALFIGLLFGF